MSNGTDAVKVVILRGEDGQIEKVVASADLDVLVLDEDVEGCEDEEIFTFAGKDVTDGGRPETEVNVRLVENMLNCCN